MGFDRIANNIKQEMKASLSGDSGEMADIATLGRQGLRLDKNKKSKVRESEMLLGDFEDIDEALDIDKAKKARKAQDAESLQSEAEKDGVDHFPDLMQNGKHRQFMQKLRQRLMREKEGGSPQEFQDEAEAFFEDSAQAYYSLVYASDVFAAEGREEIANILKDAAASLEERDGTFIKASKNISSTATPFVEAGLGTYSELRKFYHEQVYDFHDVCTTFIALYSRYGKDRFKELFSFLTTALSTDLDSVVPSSDREVLESVINDFFQVRFLDGFHRELEAKFLHMGELFILDDPCDPLDLTEGVLRFVNLEWVNPEEVRGLKDLAGCEQMEAEIYLFTQLYQSVRGIPVKIFLDMQKREDFLATLQDVLDDAIREEEEGEEEGGHEHGDDEEEE